MVWPRAISVGLAKIYLILLNTVLMISGVVTLGKGLHLFIHAEELSRNVIYHALGVDDYYMQVAMKFMVPGTLLSTLGCFGWFGAFQMKKILLACYSVSMMIIVSLNIYNMTEIHAIKISLFNYLKKNVLTSEFDVLQIRDGNPTPELAIQILALISAVYLYCVSIKKAQPALAGMFSVAPGHPERARLYFK